MKIDSIHEEMTKSDPLRISSKAKLDFLTKIARKGPESFDLHHNQRRAGRDSERATPRNLRGPIVSAGGGEPHDRPNITQSQALGAVSSFFRGGGGRDDLPDAATTTDANRNRARRPLIRRGKKIRGPIKQDGDATLRRRKGQYSNYRYWPGKDGNLGGGYHAYPPSEEPAPKKRKKKGTSKSAPKPKAQITAQDVIRKQNEIADQQAASAKRVTGRRRVRGRQPPPRPRRESIQYLSKTIDEGFDESLENALGL